MKQYKTTTITVCAGKNFDEEFTTPMPEGDNWELVAQSSHGAMGDGSDFETIVWAGCRDEPCQSTDPAT